MLATKGTNRPRSSRPLNRQQRVLRKRRVVELLGELGCVAITCRAAGISTPTFYRWKANDPNFADQCADAIELATDKLEIEARRRAVDGILKPVYRQGKQVGTVRVYSDRLLSLLLTGNRPEKYRTPGAHITVKNHRATVSADGATDVAPERQAMLNRLRTIIIGAYPEAEHAA